MKKIGVLSIQGDVSEHIIAIKQALTDLNMEGDALKVKTKEDLNKLDALIIPGGESTTIGKLLREYDLREEIKKLAEKGKPIMGTCAGLIMLSRDTNNVGSLELMDIESERNAFGGQKESFEAELHIPAIGDKKFNAVFIRAPFIKKTGPCVEVLAKYRDRIVLARQGNIIASAFHPELSDDLRLHTYFLSIILK